MASYLTDDNFLGKKGKVTKKSVTKRELKFQDCKTCLKNNKIVSATQQIFRRKEHNLFTEKSVQDLFKY